MEELPAAPVPCTRCRQRRVKCDKRQPGCIRCERSSQPCPGYNRLRKFLDEGASLHRRFSGTAKQQGEHPCRKTKQNRQSCSQPPQGSEMQGVEMLVQLDTAATTHSETSATPSLQTTKTSTPSNDGLPFTASKNTTETLSESDFETAFFNIDPVVYYADPNNCCGFIPNLDSAEGLRDRGPTLSWVNDIAVENFLPVPTDIQGFDSADTAEVGTIDDVLQENEQETAHLIGYFAERISPCLDIFDVERYFGRIVPVRALRSSLIRDSLAAIAAKQFGKTRQEAASPNGTNPPRSLLDQYSSITRAQWFYKAASFYDRAICHMMRALQLLQDHNSGSSPASLVTQEGSPARGTPPSAGSAIWTTTASSSSLKRRADRYETRQKVTDDLLAAVTVFLFYESLDNRQMEISNHIYGAQYLLNLYLKPAGDNNGEMVVQKIMPASISTKAWQASFWDFACMDIMVSYSDQTTPKLDTENFNLWKAAGLPLCSVNGLIVPGSLRGLDDSLDPIQMTETVACRTLIWIVLKTLHLIKGDEHDRSNQTASPDPVNSHLQENPQPVCWESIHPLLEEWTAALPDTYELCMTVSTASQEFPIRSQGDASFPDVSAGGTASTMNLLLSQISHNNSMCATAIALFHFVQILTLLHGPVQSVAEESHPRFVSKRLEAYRQRAAQIDRHACEIWAIGSSHRSSVERVHLLQPLYLAGLCFESKERRSHLAELLIRIEKDTGFSTANKVMNLSEEWGWNRGLEA